MIPVPLAEHIVDEVRHAVFSLLIQFEAIGLNYKTTPSKVKEDTKRGVDTEKDGLSNLLTQARDTMNEIPDID